AAMGVHREIYPTKSQRKSDAKGQGTTPGQTEMSKPSLFPAGVNELLKSNILDKLFNKQNKVDEYPAFE
ncbi:MAG TPA: hypothetical protein VGG71_12445, partial [Chitinophagaceae bacterium]